MSGYDRTIRAEIEFSCLTGHVLVGAETLTCAREGRWSGPFPSCKFVDCGQLPKLEGGTVRDGERERIDVEIAYLQCFEFVLFHFINKIIQKAVPYGASLSPAQL